MNELAVLKPHRREGLGWVVREAAVVIVGKEFIGIAVSELEVALLVASGQDLADGFGGLLWGLFHIVHWWIWREVLSGWAACWEPPLRDRLNGDLAVPSYIDLNPVRAGIVEDPKDYRFCGYAEAVAGHKMAKEGLSGIWASHADGSARTRSSLAEALQAHRELIFGKRASDAGTPEMTRKKALKDLEKEDAILPKSIVLRCRVRYFTDGAILGRKEFVWCYVGAWQLEKNRKYPPKPNLLRGADWRDLATIHGLRKQVFG